MTDVNEASDADASNKKSKKKAASTSTTPTSSRENSLSSLVAKLTPSDKKKQKTDMKKLKVDAVFQFAKCFISAICLLHFQTSKCPTSLVVIKNYFLDTRRHCKSTVITREFSRCNFHTCK